MLSNIDWKNRTAYAVRDRAEWNDLIDWYSQNGYRVQKSKTDMQYWSKSDSWNVDRDQYGNFTIYVAHSSKHPERENFFKYIYKSEKESKVKKTSGIAAIRNLEELFKSMEGVTRYVAFGKVEREDFVGFQYTPISWTDPDFLDQTLHGFFKADVSAAYPYQACKLLPDAHRAKRVQGKIPPSEEYPFAFYLKSNQLAIYGEFDTNDYLEHPLNHAFIDYTKFQKIQKKTYKREFTDRFHFVQVPEEEEITLLMRASKYNFDKEFSHLYLKRKIEEEAKQICNVSIGCLSSPNHKVSSVHQRHITSVIYARHMVRMMRLYNRIKELGGLVVSVVTDSIAWIGGKGFEISDRQKKLGAFYLEYEDTEAYYGSHGVYAIKEKDGKIKTWHQGYNVSEEFLRNMKKCSDIRKIARIFKRIRFSEKTNKFVEVQE